MAFTHTEEAQLRAVITAFESGKTISEIAASTEVFTTDALEIIQSAVSKKATIAQIITLVNSELGISAMSTKLSGIETGAQVNIIESVKVNSTVLPITSKSVDITVPTKPSDIGAEPLLPSTPSNPESRFLNGNKQWAEIVLGGGGYASNVYFTNLTSTIVGTYKQTSGTHELTETIASGTCNNNEVLIHTYLFEQPVGITTVDAGVWRVTLNSIIDAAAGDSKFKFVQFKRSAAGVETDMFTVYSNTIENRVGYEGYLNNIFETVQPSFSVDATDRLGCRIYATTTAAGSRTLSYKVGDGYASYLNTPLALRHSQLRDKNGESTYQHLTSAQVAVVNATSGINTGDETLTSIKTKLGAATAVSDGYLKYQDFANFNGKVSNATHTGDVTGATALTLATVNSNIGTFNNVTINAKGLATAGSNVNYSTDIHSNITALNAVSGINTGDETTASIKTKLGAASWVSEGYITYDDYLWFSSKEPGNANIQAHISSTSNPHSVTKNQVGLGNVDNTSDANKPVSTAMQTALNSKQASGTYSTDIHTNITALNAVLGTNTGDETLTSIKTKLGAASAVSDGYLKYQDFALLHAPTTVTASNGLSISGQNISLQDASLTQSGALTFNDWNTFNSKEPAITKNTGFNLPLGNTTGTVLEGRTFGTAANSAVGDFIQNQNSSAQSANMWISGSGRFGINPGNNGGANYLDISGSGGAGNTASGLRLINYWNGVPYEAGVYSHQSDNATSELVFKVGYYDNGAQQRTALTMLQSGAATFASTVNATQLQSTVATGTAPLTVNSSTMVSNLNAQYLNGFEYSKFMHSDVANIDYWNNGGSVISGFHGSYPDGITTGYNYGISVKFQNGAGYTNLQFWAPDTEDSNSGNLWYRTGWGTKKNVWNKLYHSGNLTNNLTTNYLPKWNGSSMVNSLISDNGAKVIIGSSSPYITLGKTGLLDWDFGNISGNNFNIRNTSIANVFQIEYSTGNIYIPSTTPSTSPTTGALVVNGGIGADHVRANNFYGNGSNLTGIQLPITLTTNGTSGAATFSGNTLNVPNYSGSGGVDQTQIAVWGSTGGNMICSMPFQTSSYKKVIIRFNNLSGDATYYYPTLFTIDPSKSEIYQQVGTFGTGGGWGTSSYTIKGTKGLYGWVILEGY